MRSTCTLTFLATATVTLHLGLCTTKSLAGEVGDVAEAAALLLQDRGVWESSDQGEEDLDTGEEAVVDRTIIDEADLYPGIETQ